MCYMPANMAIQFYKDNIFVPEGNESITDWITRQVCNHVSSVTMIPTYFASVVDQDLLKSSGKVMLRDVVIPVDKESSSVYEAKKKITDILSDMGWFVTSYTYDGSSLTVNLLHSQGED